MGFLAKAERKHLLNLTCQTEEGFCSSFIGLDYKFHILELVDPATLDGTLWKNKVETYKDRLIQIVIANQCAILFIRKSNGTGIPISLP